MEITGCTVQKLGRALVLDAFIILICFAAAQAATDPLGASFTPQIDTNCADYPSNVWVTGPLYKLRQDSGTPPACPGNYANKWITVYGTQNEFVDFQIHWHDAGSGTPNFSVSVSNFVQTAPASFTIPSTVPQIVVYREAYVNVQKFPSNTSSSRSWNTFYGTTGKYPDILIPAVDPYWKQTTNAFPFSIPAGSNQSVWVDVLIPQTAPAGYYSGTVTVKSGSTTLATLPIIIGVWQWPSGGSMPSTPSLTMLGAATNWSYQAFCTQMYAPGASTINQAACGNYPGGGGQPDTANMYVGMDAELVMKDHRYPSGARSAIYTDSGFTPYNTLTAPLMGGTCNLHNGAGTACPILPASKNNARNMSFNTASAATWSAWDTNFRSQGWRPTLYDYLCDEPPNGCAWSTLLTNGTNRHGYLTPGIPELVTTDLNSATANGVQNVIDWMVVGTTVLDPVNRTPQSASTYQSWLAGSSSGIPRKWLSYQACGNAGTCTNGTPGPGPSGNTYMTYANYNVDGLPVANRAMEWQTALHGQSGELYYAEDICAYPGYMSQCVPSGVSYDPWSGIYYAGGWGDGTRLYTGSNVPGSVNYMGPGVTIPLILPSIRLTLARDGVQDYEYINMLRSLGQSALVSSTISSWVTDDYTFNVNPVAPQYGFASDLIDARQTLGSTLHQLSIGASSTSPCDINGDGVINVVDVQLEVNMALGINACTNASGTCTVVSAQRVVNAALGGSCVAP